MKWLFNSTSFPDGAGYQQDNQYWWDKQLQSSLNIDVYSFQDEEMFYAATGMANSPFGIPLNQNEQCLFVFM